MKPKFPAISYIVTAKRYKNNAGLEVLHEKIFSNENFLEVRNLAFDYFSAVVEILMHQKEIELKNATPKIPINKENMENIISQCNNFEVDYKNSENFFRGIQVFIRINKTINLGNKILKAKEKLLIQSFNFLNDEENKIIAENLNTEFEIYERLKQKTEKIYSINFIDENGYLQDLSSLETYNRFNGKSFENYKRNIEQNIEKKVVSEILGLMINPNPLRIEFCDVSELQDIAESICAFLNGKDFGYILLNHNKKKHILEEAELRNMFIRYFNERFVWENHFIRLHKFKNGNQTYFALSIDGKNCKDEVRFSKNLNEDYEFYERKKIGNVLVWE